MYLTNGLWPSFLARPGLIRDLRSEARQHQRDALAMLATSSHDGATQALLSARSFDASLIASPVNEGLVTLTTEKMQAGGKLIAVAKARITH
jgi:hypothetical protein